jgi:hypothetical protein
MLITKKLLSTQPQIVQDLFISKSISNSDAKITRAKRFLERYFSLSRALKAGAPPDALFCDAAKTSLHQALHFTAHKQKSHMHPSHENQTHTDKSTINS